MTVEWNKVTWYSKIAAVIIFVGTFFLGFWLGTMKVEKVYVEVPRVVHRASQIRNTDWMKYFDERFSSSSYTIDCGEDRHNFTIDKTEYSDLNNDGEEDAVVKYYGCWNGTGGGQSEVLTLSSSGLPIELSVSNGVPEGEEKLLEGAQGYAYFRINKDGKLQFDFPLYKNYDPNCCPTGGTKSIVYKWNKAEQQFEVNRIFVLPPDESL